MSFLSWRLFSGPACFTISHHPLPFSQPTLRLGGEDEKGDKKVTDKSGGKGRRRLMIKSSVTKVQKLVTNDEVISI